MEIIVLAVSRKEPGPSRKKSLRGCLRHYANPALIVREKDAWQDVVKEKYDHY